MSLLTQIREKAGAFVLKREYAHALRKRKICNIEAAHNIGILYYLPDEAAYDKVSRYVKRLQDRGKTVKALGFVENKHLTGQFLPKLSYDFLYPSGLSWHMKPNSATARDFMQKEFDILIDLSMDDIIPLIYTLALSKARFKVGMQSDIRAEYMDMMISLSGRRDLNELIEQLDHYLNELNKKYES
ncbi:MAG TPA: hypothetical protein VK994_06720 [Bacteroidales bacterium]|nr:hypothetical protein [Bacteroidales bacterium]